METNFVIGVIAQILALGGVVSIRMFLPAFLYFLALHFAVKYPAQLPAILVDMAAKVPAWQISYIFLGVMGVMAALELMAVRNADIKQFLTEDIDRYAKPVMAFLVTFSVVDSAQADTIRDLMSQQVQVAGFGFLGIAAGAVIAGYTALMCKLRELIYEKIYAVDPDGSLGVQKIFVVIEEFLLVGTLLILVFMPVLAIIICLCGLAFRFMYKKLAEMLDKSNSHPCPECQSKQLETPVSNCAVICQVCGAEQSSICRVGWFGFCSKTPLGRQPLLTHQLKLLSYKRCKWCAKPLKNSNVCDCCGREQWDDPELLRKYVSGADIRGGILLVLALLSILFPVVGFVIVLIVFRPVVLRPLAVHLNKGSRFLISCLGVFFKLLFGLIMLWLSLIPGIGLIVLLPFILRYFMVRKQFLASVSKKRV